ncbi:MAG: type II secretion system protein [Victivallales bacterium]|nr:type II secretion system protein [Victivallales bacterium]
MSRNSYTFIEILVVCVIVMLIMALVIPQIGGGSRRIAVESALSNLRGAFTETAMRARAGGRPLALVLDVEQRQFTVYPWNNPLDHDWHAPVLPPMTGPAGQSGILPGAQSYEVSKDIAWTDLPEGNFGDGQFFAFCFFPDGEASGPQLRFEVQGWKYLLVVDSVLGKVTILEES